MFTLIVEYGLVHRGGGINCETLLFFVCFVVLFFLLLFSPPFFLNSVVIRLLYGRVLGAQTFTLLSL